MSEPDQRGGATVGDASCSLGEDERRQRADWVRDHVLDHYRGIEEREDGYALTFAATEESVTAVTRLAYLESGCCSESAFAVEPAPPYEELELTVTGPDGTKELLRHGWVEEFDPVAAPD